MNKIDKPCFEFSILDKVGTLFGIIIPIIVHWLSNWYWTIISLLIIILLVIISILIKYKKQTELLYNEYLKIYTNHSALAKQFDKKSQEIQNFKSLLTEYDFILKQIIYNLNFGIMNISQKEKSFLTKLYQTLLEDKAYLYKLGGNIYGKKF